MERQVMGYQPARPPWKRGETPTTEQREAYRAYLVGSLARIPFGRRKRRKKT